MRGLMELAHKIALAQIAHGAEDAATQEEREALEGWAQGLSAAQIHRLWQLLLKGHSEVRKAPDPLVAAQMALLRVLHASTLPDPGDLAKRIENLALSGAANPPAQSAGAPAAGVSAQADWDALIARVDQSGALAVAQMMRDWVRVVSLRPGELVYDLAPGLVEDPGPDLRDALLKATGERWQVTRGQGEFLSTQRERAEADKANARARVLADPLVEAAFAAFPEAELVEEADVAGSERNWSRRA